MAQRVWRVLIAHGAGMTMRGRVEIEKFGPLTLPEIEAHISSYGSQLNLQLEFFTTNTEGQLIDKIYESLDTKDGIVINPAGFTMGYRALNVAVGQINTKLPIVEVHFSNPASNNVTSQISPAVKGLVHGFGVHGYFFALSAIRKWLDDKDAATPAPSL